MLNQLPRPRHGLIGHRGAAGLAPENTLLGFQKAAAIGLSWVEFDVQCCASGEWVVFHDDTLSRTTNGQGLLAQTPWKILKNFDAGSWFTTATDHPAVQQTGIPLLEEALQTCVHLGLHPNIEVKSTPHQRITQRSLIDLYCCIKTHWPSNNPPPLLSSFNETVLFQLKSILPADWPLGYLLDESTPIFKLQHAFAFDSLHCHYQAFSPTLLHAARERHIALLLYTLNNPQRIQELLHEPTNAPTLFGIFSDMTFYES